jgi:hypothetical protein
VADRRRLAAVVALWAIVMAATSLAAGCYGHNCDGDIQVFGRNPGEGQLLDPDTWQSNPVDGVWLPFPTQRLDLIELRDLGDRAPELIVPYVSAESNPHEALTNFTVAAGNIAELSGAEKGRLAVRNGTCSDYYLRVVVKTSPRPPVAALTDAGTDAEAGP